MGGKRAVYLEESVKVSDVLDLLMLVEANKCSLMFFIFCAHQVRKCSYFQKIRERLSALDSMKREIWNQLVKTRNNTPNLSLAILDDFYFYRTRVRSLGMLVTNWLTHSCLVNLIDLTLLLLLMLMIRIVLATVCCRFGSWGLIIK